MYKYPPSTDFYGSAGESFERLSLQTGEPGDHLCVMGGSYGKWQLGGGVCFHNLD